VNEHPTHGAPLQKLAPRLLIFVEGVSENCSPIPNKHWAFWGGALDSAAAAPVRLTLPSKLVYSPHVYGPGAGLAALQLVPCVHSL
jgi:endoglucanase